jgi:glycosyltransferase involved in cell wall biosynthesis
MKIGYVCFDVDVPVLGNEGCSIHIRELVNAFADDGHEVFVLCAEKGEGTAAPQAALYEIRPRGLDAISWEQLAQEDVVSSGNLDRDLRSLLLNNVWANDAGAEIIDREQPDFIYERYSLFGTGGLSLARRIGVPLLLEVNAPLCLEQAGYAKFPLEQTARALEAEIFRRADAIVAVSDWLGQHAISGGAGPQAVHVIPNGVGAGFAALASDGVRDRLRLGTRPVIGYVGSFQGWHDLDGLIEAFSAVKRTNEDAALLLVGDGPSRERAAGDVARRGLEANVVFAGLVPHDAMPAYLAAMDVVAVPYRNDDDFYFSPLKLFEAMASGRPTVAARIGQIADVVEHGRTGWLYTPGDHHDLAASLDLLLQARERAVEIGKAGRQAVLARHTWRAVARQVVSIAGAVRK